MGRMIHANTHKNVAAESVMLARLAIKALDGHAPGFAAQLSHRGTEAQR